MRFCDHTFLHQCLKWCSIVLASYCEGGLFTTTHTKFTQHPLVVVMRYPAEIVWISLHIWHFSMTYRLLLPSRPVSPSTFSLLIERKLATGLVIRRNNYRLMVKPFIREHTEPSVFGIWPEAKPISWSVKVGSRVPTWSRDQNNDYHQNVNGSKLMMVSNSHTLTGQQRIRDGLGSNHSQETWPVGRINIHVFV